MRLTLVLLLMALFRPDAVWADYKTMLKHGATRDAVEALYDQYHSEVLEKQVADSSQVIERLAGGADFKQSFLLACLSNGKAVRAIDLDHRNLPPSGVWAYSKANYGGIVKQFPSDCKDMHCMDVATFQGYLINSLRLGANVKAQLHSKDGFDGESMSLSASCEKLPFQPHSMRLRNPPRIDYLTVSNYRCEPGKASFRLHVSGANIDDGSQLLIDRQVVESEIELHVDNSKWLGLGNDLANGGYNSDPTFFAFPVFHYDSIATEIENVLMKGAISVSVENSIGLISNTLTYVVPSPDELDSDGDGLLDQWELGSVDGLDLVKLGANPHRKDVYVEVDRMVVPGRIWSDFSERSYPSKATFEESIRSYASAPIINPDLSVGIKLHVDYGQEKFEKASIAEGGTEIPWKRFLGFKRSAEFRRKHPDYYDAEELRQDPANFSPNRFKVFRYCVFGDQQWSSRSTGGGDFRSTFFVTLGVTRMNAVNTSYQTGVFLHELGHMFGLSHQGAGKSFNYKPNFNSVMNYKFVFDGTDADGRLASGIKKSGAADHIYSYSEGMRATLNESELNEVLGVANHYPIDWNKNGVIDQEPISQVISRHQKSNQPRVLKDFADWGNMDFKPLGTTRVVARSAPRQLTERKIRGLAKVPDRVEFGFMCDVDGIIQTGNWKVVGTVTRHLPGKIVFETNEFRVRNRVRTKSMTGRLAYSLPDNLALPLAVGDPLTILHDYSSEQKRLERNLHISSGTHLVLATSHLNESAVPRSADRAELTCETIDGGQLQFYWSDPADDDQQQDLKVVPHISPAVSLKSDSSLASVAIEKAKQDYQPVALNGSRFLFRILDLHQDRPEGEAVARSKRSEADRDAEEQEPGMVPDGECLLIRAVESNLQ